MRFILTIFLFHLTLNHSAACRCIPFKNAKVAYKASDVVLSITVLEILSPIQPIDTVTSENGDTYISVPLYGYPKRVLINTIYKGKNISDTMLLPGEKTNCELYLEVGKSYIVYGWLKENQIYTSKCTRSGSLENHRDLAFLQRKIRKH